MKVSDYIAAYLERRGVSHVFELVGGMITFLLDSLQQKTSVKIISMHHEQGAAFAAEGYGRATGIPGVAMATSGPGATNLLTAIGSCHFDSTPAIFITGQVNRHEQKGTRAIRQLGFQETDIVAMALPITKAAWLVNDPNDIPRMLEEAFVLASSGRPGPVLIDIPMDVQRAEINDLSRLDQFPPSKKIGSHIEIDAFWDDILRQLEQSERPLILAGGGLRSGLAVDDFRVVVEKLGVPVIHSLMGVDLLSASHPQRAGLLGSYGNRWTNIALSESDFMLVLGSRLDVRQTGADTDGFKSGRAIFHVDCEPGEMNNRVTGCHSLVSELAPFLSRGADRIGGPTIREAWQNRITGLKAEWPDVNELPGLEGINPNVFMHRLSAVSGAASAFVVDVGQHQMWAAQSLDLEGHQRFMTSGGMGAMGFSLPAAIGAAYGSGKPVVVVAGDGSFQLNIQELQTVARNKLPLKMIVINNGCHGMVRQFQEAYFKERYQSTLWGYSAPSFSSVAAAYGIPSLILTDPGEIDTALRECWLDPDSPFLLEVGIAKFANAYPKMAFGRPISDMEPFAKPLDMEGT